MMRIRDHTGDSEHAFGFAFPQKRSLEPGLANKRGRLSVDIDQSVRHHRHRKGDRDLITFTNFTRGRLKDDAAGIGMDVGILLFLFFFNRPR